MACKAVIKPVGTNIEIHVCKTCPLSIKGRTINVPYYLLALDASYSVLGESVIGFLIYQHRIEESDEKCFSKIEKTVKTYRKRLILEESSTLAYKIGRLISLSDVSPLFFPVSRSILLGPPISCIGLNQDDDMRKSLASAYRNLAQELGVLRGNKLVYERVTGVVRRLSTTYRNLIKLSPSLFFLKKFAGMESECENPEYAVAVGGLIRLPEGKLFLSRLEPKKAVEVSTGRKPVECKSGGATSSSLICDLTDGEKIVVKLYEKMLVKWFPAVLASPPESRFIMSPRMRMANEYRWLRELRKVAHTPRIHLVFAGLFNRGMVREYVNGTPALSSKACSHWRMAGETIAKIHNQGIILGDPNPGNFIIRNDSDTAVIDAEQARPFTPAGGAWDIVVFTVYSILFNASPKCVSTALAEYWNMINRGVKHEILGRLEAGKIWGGVKALPLIYTEAKRIVRDSLNHH